MIGARLNQNNKLCHYYGVPQEPLLKACRAGFSPPVNSAAG